MSDAAYSHSYGHSHSPSEIIRTASAAAQALYRLSRASGFDSALGAALREKSTKVLGGVAGLGNYSGKQLRIKAGELLAETAAVRELISLGRTMDWIKPENSERVLRAYGRIEEWLAAIGRPQKQLNERQRRIAEYLAAHGRVRIGDILARFGQGISAKTIRRDLWQLANAGLIQKTGDNRWATYVSIGHKSDVR